MQAFGGIGAAAGFSAQWLLDSCGEVLRGSKGPIQPQGLFVGVLTGLGCALSRCQAHSPALDAHCFTTGLGHNMLVHQGFCI